MTFSAALWPRSDDAVRATHRYAGAVAVGRRELAKVARLVRVHALLAGCVAVPFVAAAALRVQDAVPADTLFGQWTHQSGYALAMVVLGFSGQWALPFVVAAVAGDIFSAEDRFGTWQTVLTRSRSRREIFLGKALAVLIYTVVSLAVLTAASLGAAAWLGGHPVVGLGGQLVRSGTAARLVVLSFAVQLPPMLAYAALSVLLSVASRNSVVGVGGPVLLGLGCQLAALINLPNAVRIALPSTAFGSWHGLWVPHQFLDPIRHGILVSAGWCVVSLVAAWLIFRRRSVRAPA